MCVCGVLKSYVPDRLIYSMPSTALLSLNPFLPLFASNVAALLLCTIPYVYVCMYLYVCICMCVLGLEYEDNAEQYNAKAAALSSSCNARCARAAQQKMVKSL